MTTSTKTASPPSSALWTRRPPSPSPRPWWTSPLAVISELSAPMCLPASALPSGHSRWRRPAPAARPRPADAHRQLRSCTRRSSPGCRSCWRTPSDSERYWAEQWAALSAGRAALEKGAVTIDEYPDVDLAVVRRLDPPMNGAPPAPGDTPDDERPPRRLRRRPSAASGRGPLRHVRQPDSRLRRREMRALLPIRKLGPDCQPAGASPARPRSARARAERGGAVGKALEGERGRSPRGTGKAG